jgi:hypothetical protein
MGTQVKEIGKEKKDQKKPSNMFDWLRKKSKPVPDEDVPYGADGGAFVPPEIIGLGSSTRRATLRKKRSS